MIQFSKVKYNFITPISLFMRSREFFTFIFPPVLACSLLSLYILWSAVLRAGAPECVSFGELNANAVECRVGIVDEKTFHRREQNIPTSDFGNSEIPRLSLWLGIMKSVSGSISASLFTSIAGLRSYVWNFHKVQSFQFSLASLTCLYFLWREKSF